VLRDLRIDHLSGDDFGRVFLVMDGRRVLLNYVPKKAETVAELLHRRNKGTTPPSSTALAPGRRPESWAPARPGDQPPAVAVAGALGDNVYVTHDTSGEPFLPPSAELLDYLRQIANHDDVPDTVQTDARDYLRHREAASSDFISGTAEPRVTVAHTGDLQSVRQLVEVPRPRCGTI
jgi:hypothetical protein